MRWRAAVILTHNRPTELFATCMAVGGYTRSELHDELQPKPPAQVDLVVVVENASPDPVPNLPQVACDTVLLRIPDQPPNLAKLMNIGLDEVAKHVPSDAKGWDVAMLCDDAPPPAGWFGAVTGAMWQSGAMAGSTHGRSPVQSMIFKDHPDRDLENRMVGWAFVLRGESGIRANEDLWWWWQDTDLDWQARLAGGMVIAPGPVVPNLHYNSYTNARPDLAARVGLDAAAFAERWREHGGQPW